MEITFKLHDHTFVELRGKVINRGTKGNCSGPWEYSWPPEGPEIEYVKAWIIRNNVYRQVSPQRLIAALERRYGEDWERYAEQVQ